jgi:hypothetical protein
VETAQSAYEAGRQMPVPLIIGANSADFVGFISAAGSTPTGQLRQDGRPERSGPAEMAASRSQQE